MNPFYAKNKFVQWIIAIPMLLLAFTFMGVFFDFFTERKIAYPLFLILVPLIQFLSAPFFTLIGMYKYLSPMLLVFGANEKKYDLHNGTSFDYLMVMRKVKPGIEWRNKMLSYYLEGLLKVILKIETGELPNTVEVRGSSYFFSEATAKRMGFEISKTGLAEKINLAVNYIDLTWSLSLSKGKFEWPNLKEIKTASISGANLVKNKERLLKIHKYITR